MVKSDFNILASEEAKPVALLQQTTISSFVAALRKQIMPYITKLKKIS